MSDEGRFQPRPAAYKTAMDGLPGLVRIIVDGGLHAGRELYIDEAEVPPEIYVTPKAEPFEWWPARLREAMAATALGGDPENPPTRYVLTTDAASGEPRYVPESDSA